MEKKEYDIIKMVQRLFCMVMYMMKHVNMQ